MPSSKGDLRPVIRTYDGPHLILLQPQATKSARTLNANFKTRTTPTTVTRAKAMTNIQSNKAVPVIITKVVTAIKAVISSKSVNTEPVEYPGKDNTYADASADTRLKTAHSSQ